VTDILTVKGIMAHFRAVVVGAICLLFLEDGLAWDCPCWGRRCLTADAMRFWFAVSAEASGAAKGGNIPSVRTVAKGVSARPGRGPGFMGVLADTVTLLVIIER
jgi:hypothetical protein